MFKLCLCAWHACVCMPSTTCNARIKMNIYRGAINRCQSIHTKNIYTCAQLHSQFLWIGPLISFAIGRRSVLIFITQCRHTSLQ